MRGGKDKNSSSFRSPQPTSLHNETGDHMDFLKYFYCQEILKGFN